MKRKTPKYIEQPPCANCGGRHYGDPPGYCPYVSSPCVICGDDTIYACSDCAIDNGGKKSVHVCAKAECQTKHEKLHPSATPHDICPELGRTRGGTNGGRE